MPTSFIVVLGSLALLSASRFGIRPKRSPKSDRTGFTDAYYKLSVPTESAVGSGDEVIDFSAQFQYAQGAGLQMEVLDRRARTYLPASVSQYFDDRVFAESARD